MFRMAEKTSPPLEDQFPNRQTDRVMAFDVCLRYEALDRKGVRPCAVPAGINVGPPDLGVANRVRKVALFEGKDEFGCLQPLLGTAKPATDAIGNPITWPQDDVYVETGLVGRMEGSIAWHSPTNEDPAPGDVEDWEIWNAMGDAHPVHLHLVNFEVRGRHEIICDSNS